MQSQNLHKDKRVLSAAQSKKPEAINFNSIKKNSDKQEQPICFIDLQAQKDYLGTRISDAIQRVLDHGHYIMGPEIFELERQLSNFSGAKHVLTCSNGTDALLLILMAKGIKPGDAVLVPGFTFAATAEVVANLGATPIFLDVLPDTFNLNPAEIGKGMQLAKSLNLTPRAVIAVDLFGQPADYETIEKECQKYDLWLLADAAQSFGASFKGRKVGTIGLATATSFYPAKPLGCYGDGGAIFTDNDELAEILKSLRIHGQGSHRYDCARIGMNGRLDTLQAAILLEKLAIFAEEIVQREKIAARYHEAFKGLVQVQKVLPQIQSVWAQYTIILEKGRRDRIVQALSEKGIPTAVHYPKPLHFQPAYCGFPCSGGSFGNESKNSLPVAEDLAERVLSLPMHPYLSTISQERIIAALFSLLN